VDSVWSPIITDQRLSLRGNRDSDRNS